MPQLFKRPDIFFKYSFGLGKRLHRPLYAFLAQQMKYRKRCSVGVVADIVGLGAVKLKPWMKAGQLHHAFESMLVQHAFGNLHEIVEIQKIIEKRWMDQQRRVEFLGGRVDQQVKLAVEFFQQVVGMARLAHDQANLVLDINGLGKRAKVQADHSFFKPVTGLLQNLFLRHVHEQSPCTCKILPRNRLCRAAGGVAPSKGKSLRVVSDRGGITSGP